MVSGGGSVSETEGGGIAIAVGSLRPGLAIPLTLNTRDYNLFRVRMRVSKGSAFQLNWRSDVESNYEFNPWSVMPIRADGEWHSYTIELNSGTLGRWRGLVNELRFFPSDQPAEVEIEYMEFAHKAPDGPQRLRIGSEMTEVLFGSLPDWEFLVPPEAVFEVKMGMALRAWDPYSSDGVRFVVNVVDSQGNTEEVIGKTSTPVEDESHRDWSSVQVDMGRFSGQRVRLRFSVEPLGSTVGDYAFWGNPIVYSQVPEPDATPVILISCDTLRADHLSVYGYERGTSPFLDAFAAEGVVYENAIVQDAWTLPSHTTMLTGLYPKNHGVDTATSRLSESVVTLAAALGGQGYLTGGFTGTSWWLEGRYGFAHGFDVYSVPSPYRDIFQVTEAATRWTGAHGISKFFLFLHNYDVHSKSDSLGYELPYGPDSAEYVHYSEEFREPGLLKREGKDPLSASNFMIAANRQEITPTDRERAYLEALYDDSIRAVDRGIQTLIEDLKARGLYDAALIIVTADHGEAFGEHGTYMHEDAYEQCARVPLIIKYPHGRHGGLRVSEVVQLADIFTTVLDVVGIDSAGSTDGQSLLAVLEERTAPTELAYTRRAQVDGVRLNEWKLLYNRRTEKVELYNLLDDPGETRNVVEQYSEMAARLDSERIRFYGDSKAGWRLLAQGGSEETTVQIVVSSETEAFAHAEVSFGEASDQLRVLNDGRVVECTLLLGPGDSDELVVRPKDYSSPVFVSMQGTKTFSVVLGEGDPIRAASFQATLNPLQGMLGRRGPNVAGTEPRLTVWIESPDPGVAAAAGLSAEEIRQLQSLGYLQ